jgi:hypothetical protein
MGKVKETMGMKLISLNSVVDYDTPTKIEHEVVDNVVLAFEVWTLVLRSGVEVTFKTYGSDGFNLENMLSGLKPRQLLRLPSENILNETKVF